MNIAVRNEFNLISKYIIINIKVKKNKRYGHFNIILDLIA